MTDAVWPTIELSKLDAASRQLDVAVRLLFANEDPVAVHTLAHAAFGVLKGVAERRGGSRFLAHAAEEDSRNANGKFWRDFNRVGNFLKHGNEDPDGYLSDIPEEINEALIFLGTRIFRDLGASLTPEIEAFSLWYRAINFANVEDAKEPFLSWVAEHAELLHAEDRNSLLLIGADLLRRYQTHYGAAQNRAASTKV